MKIVYKYKDFVEKDKITFNGDINENIRYLLKISLKNSTNKKVLVIMKNPSKANNKVSDLTIDRVLTFCNSEGYSEVNIMNLFSYYSTDPIGIKNLIDNGQIDDAIGAETDEIMKKVVKEVDEIIVAWGGNSINREKHYKNRIKQVANIIKGKNTYYVQSISKNTYYPRHAQVWNVKSGIEKYKWIPKFDY